jgi:hypothetical protein
MLQMEYGAGEVIFVVQQIGQGHMRHGIARSELDGFFEKISRERRILRFDVGVGQVQAGSLIAGRESDRRLERRHCRRCSARLLPDDAEIVPENRRGLPDLFVVQGFPWKGGQPGFCVSIPSLLDQRMDRFDGIGILGAR